MLALFLFFSLQGLSAVEPLPARPIEEPSRTELDRLGVVEFGPRPANREIPTAPGSLHAGRRWSAVRPTPDCEAWELVDRDESYLVRTTIPLGDLRSAGKIGGPETPQCLRTGDHTWVVTVTEKRPSNRSYAWRVDDRTGRAVQLEAFECPAVWGMAVLPDDGFAVLANRWTPGSSVTTLIGFDRDGKTSWTVESTRDASDRRRLFAPGSVVFTRKGNLVVRDPVRRVCQVFDLDGRFLEASDEWVGCRIGDTVPVRPPERLAVEIDLSGRIYALDASTRVVDVYDRDGTWMRACCPEPSDFPADYWFGNVAVRSDGSVYVEDRDAVRYLAFGPDGARRGWEALGLGRSGAEWRFKPVGGERWVVQGYSVFLVADDGSLRQPLDLRGEDGKALYPSNAAVAPDGSVAVLTTPSPLDWKMATYAVHLHDGDGGPLRRFDVPSDVRKWHPALAWSGTWLAIAKDGGEFLLVHTTMGQRRRFVPTSIGAEYPGFDPFVAADGRELWLVDRGGRRVLRYAFPRD